MDALENLKSAVAVTTQSSELQFQVSLCEVSRELS